MTLILEHESTTGTPAKGVALTLGVEKLLEAPDLLKGSRVGLICNQASVNHRYRHVADLFHEHPDIELCAFFGPQHGIRGDVQDNMIETEHSIDRKTGLPIYSLYSETRVPTEAMLRDIDVLVFDMQDVGCRIYTFVYTMANCMPWRSGRACVICRAELRLSPGSVTGVFQYHSKRKKLRPKLCAHASCCSTAHSLLSCQPESGSLSLKSP